MSAPRERRPARLVAAAALALAGAGLVAADPLAAPATALNLSAIAVPPGFEHGRVLVLRPDRVDLAFDGRVLRAVPHTGALDLATLPELVRDPGYVSRLDRTTLRLSAPLLQRPGTGVVAAAPRVERLVLGAGIGLFGTRATLTLTGVTVESRPEAGGTRGGFLRYATGSVVRLEGTHLVGLGTVGRRPTPALRLSHGAARISDSVITGGGPGLLLQGETLLALTRVGVTGSGGDGVVIENARELRLTGLTVSGSHGVGVRVVGPVGVGSLPGPIAVRGNTDDGLELRNTSRLAVSDVSSASNRGAGVRLRSATNMTVSRVTSTQDAVAVAVEASTGIHLTGVRADRSGSGVTVKAGHGVRIDDTRITRATSDGIDLGGEDLIVAGSTVAGTQEGLVAGTQEGLVVEGGSKSVSVQDSALWGSHDAVRVAGVTAGTSLANLTLLSPRGVALRVSGAGTSLRGCTLTGALGIVARDRADRLSLTQTSVTADGTALDLGAGTGAATVTGGVLSGRGDAAVIVDGASLTLRTTVVNGGATGMVTHGTLVANGMELSAAGTGLRITGSGRATVTDGSITAGTVGVVAAKTASATLNQTEVHAPTPSDGPVTFHGDNRWSHLPVRWLGLALVVAVTGAIGLEITRKVRDRSATQHGEAPLHVLNRN